MSRSKQKLRHVMVQAGGSSGERYIHGFNNLKECRAYKKSCAEGSCAVSEPIPIPRPLRALEDSAESDLMELLKSVAQESARID